MNTCNNNIAKRRGRPRLHEPSKEPVANSRGPLPKVNWDDENIQNLAMQSYAIGLSIAEVCALCSAAPDGFYRWLRRNPHFEEKLENARAKRKTHALNSAYGRAFPAANSDKKGDTPMAMFLLRTQFGLREEPATVVQIANVSTDAKPKDMQKLVNKIPEMSDEELMRIAGGQASLPPGRSDVVDVEDAG